MCAILCASDERMTLREFASQKAMHGLSRVAVVVWGAEIGRDRRGDAGGRLARNVVTDRDTQTETHRHRQRQDTHSHRHTQT